MELTNQKDPFFNIYQPYTLCRYEYSNIDFIWTNRKPLLKLACFSSFFGFLRNTLHSLGLFLIFNQTGPQNLQLEIIMESNASSLAILMKTMKNYLCIWINPQSYLLQIHSSLEYGSHIGGAHIPVIHGNNYFKYQRHGKFTNPNHSPTSPVNEHEANVMQNGQISSTLEIRKLGK